MNSLPQCPAFVGFFEIVVRGDDDAKQFQNTQQAQEPAAQEPEVGSAPNARLYFVGF